MYFKNFLLQLAFIGILIFLFSDVTAQSVFLNDRNITGVSAEVISSDKNSTTIEFIFNGYNEKRININGNTYLDLAGDGMVWTMEKGYPQIPVYRNSIIIPDMEAVNFRIISEGTESINTIPVAPSKGHFTRDIKPEDVPYSFNKIYSENIFYPEKTVSLSDAYIVRDLRGITIQFNPIKFNSVKKELKLTKRLVLEVYTDKSLKAINPLVRKQPFRGISAEFKDIYEDLFLNFGFDKYSYTPIPEPGRLLVIYHQNYASKIQPFIDWKIQKGIPTLSAEYPTHTGSGSTAIKTYIQNLYNSAEGLTYIVLVGEAEQIPTMNGVYEGAASDPCYTKLAGTDAYPDAYISRISPTSPENCAYIIKKIIKYEKYPDVGAAAGWYYKLAGVASNEKGSTPLYDWERMNLLRDTLLSHGFMSMDQIYDPRATTTQVFNSVNSGISIINYIGHGSGTSWSTTGFSVTNIRNLNNGYKNPFIIDVACQNGKFTLDECMEEAWIRAGDTVNPKGAIAVYGASTNASWVPPCDMQSHAISLLANRLRTTVGGICFNGVMKAMDLWNGSTGEGLKLMEQYNIFGDCSMTMNFGLRPDSIAPAAINDLRSGDKASNSITLLWTSPLDSSYGGIVAYDIRYSQSIINEDNFSNCEGKLYAGQKDSAGMLKSFTVKGLSPQTQYYFAVKSKDMWGNNSLISNVINGTTLSAPVIKVYPDSLKYTLLPNMIRTDSIKISNIATVNSTLDYEVEFTNNAFPQKSFELRIIPAQKSGLSSNNQKRESEESGSNFRGQGGPDAFGYKWIDSDQPQGPVYIWEDISESGIQVTTWTATGSLSPTDEGYFGPINLGFNFKFYGQNKNQIYISTNGFITFSPISGNTYTNTNLPSTTTPNEIIAPFWDDLDAKAPGKVYYKTEGNRLIIQWSNYQRYSGTAGYTWQLHLYSSGKIMIYYKEMTGTLNSATTGIENETGTIGLQTSYNSTYVKNNFALKFASEPDWFLNSNILSGTLGSNNSANILLTLRSEDFPAGNYSINMIVKNNSSNQPILKVPVKMEILSGTNKIAVNKPNGGEQWNVGSERRISWVSIGLNKIKIEYSIDNGNTWNKIADSVNASLFNYTWLVPNTPSGNCKIRLIDLANQQIGDTSDAVFTISGQMSCPVFHKQGWNIVSAPLVSFDMSKNTLFPSAVSDAYEFDGYYKKADTLKAGKGYWLKFAQQGDCLINGAPITEYSIPVNAGWNIIGIYDKDVIASGIVSQPPDIITSAFYEFVNGYKNADTLRSGTGYWIKSNQSGTLIINLLMKMKGELSSVIPNVNTEFSVTDVNGETRRLKITEDNLDLSRFELPPLPPNDVFDVRFVYNRDIVKSSEDGIIQINGNNYPVKIKAIKNKIHIRDLVNGELINKDLSENEEFIINDKAIRTLKINVLNPVNTFSLSQNYPNPFNPVTVINYSVPELSGSEVNMITLKIFDILGNSVATLVNEVKKPGNYKVEFNSAGLATGIYFYELKCGNLKDVKKMILMK